MTWAIAGFAGLASVGFGLALYYRQCFIQAGATIEHQGELIEALTVALLSERKQMVAIAAKAEAALKESGGSHAGVSAAAE